MSMGMLPLFATNTNNPFTAGPSRIQAHGTVNDYHVMLLNNHTHYCHVHNGFAQILPFPDTVVGFTIQTNYFVIFTEDRRILKSYDGLGWELFNLYDSLDETGLEYDEKTNMVEFHCGRFKFDVDKFSNGIDIHLQHQSRPRMTALHNNIHYVVPNNSTYHHVAFRNGGIREYICEAAVNICQPVSFKNRTYVLGSTGIVIGDVCGWTIIAPIVEESDGQQTQLAAGSAQYIAASNDSKYIYLFLKNGVVLYSDNGFTYRELKGAYNTFGVSEVFVSKDILYSYSIGISSMLYSLELLGGEGD